PELAQEELAEMIGSSRPMVSKLLTEMTERGLLRDKADATFCWAALVSIWRHERCPGSKRSRVPKAQVAASRSTKEALCAVQRGQRQHNRAVGLSRPGRQRRRLRRPGNDHA